MLCMNAGIALKKIKLQFYLIAICGFDGDVLLSVLYDNAGVNIINVEISFTYSLMFSYFEFMFKRCLYNTVCLKFESRLLYIQ